jgi:hypothetical protein
MMSSCTSVAVWMNSTTERVQHRALAARARHTGGHQQHGRTDPLAAAVLHVAADVRYHRHRGVDVASEGRLDLFEVLADRLEQLQEGGGRGLLRGGVHAAEITPYRARSVNACSGVIRGKRWS